MDEAKSKHLRIIEKIVQKDSCFEENEHLFGEFCEEIYKKTYLILGTKQTKEDLEEYLTDVSHKIMVDVVRKYIYEKYITQTNQKNVQINEQKIEEKKEEYPKDTESSPPSANVQDEVNNIKEYLEYINITDPALYIKSGSLKRETVRKILDAIYDIHVQMPDRMYFQIFYYKYFKQIEQGEIAKKLNISQGELSKRLLEMVQIMKGLKVKID